MGINVPRYPHDLSPLRAARILQSTGVPARDPLVSSSKDGARCARSWGPAAGPLFGCRKMISWWFRGDFMVIYGDLI